MSTSKSASIYAFLLIVAPFLFASSVFAQATGTVEGEVVDAQDGTTIPGVNVVVGEDGTMGAATDIDGQYAISNIPAGEQTIYARFIGYETASATVVVEEGETVEVDFTLQRSQMALDELVVTGTTGDTRRRAIGNVVTQVNAAEITERASNTTMTELLQGASPGLTLMPGSGTVGTSASIRIRGASSLNAGNNPVVYIDGVRVSTGSQGNFTAYGQGTSAFDAINPQDVESIEIIKGPAAATLYGADASSGVIQIITKSGQGQEGLSFNASVEAGQTDWAVDTHQNYGICTQEKLDNPELWPGCEGVSAGTMISTNPLRDHPEALRSGDLRRYSLSVRGGEDAYSFYIAGDIDREQGVFHNNFSNRNAARANFDFFPIESLDLSVNMSYNQNHTRLPLNDNIAYGLIISSTLAQAGRDYSWPGGEGFFTLAPEVSNTYDNQTRGSQLTLGTTATYRPTDFISNRLTVGIDQNNRRAQLFYRPDDRAPFGVAVADGYISERRPETTTYTVDYTGTVAYELTSALMSNSSVGAQYTGTRYGVTTATGQDLGSELTPSVSAAAVTTGGQSFSEYNSLGFYLQQQLAWEDRLFVTGAVRMDDNSAFGSDFSRVIYPKASLSYVISEEDFFDVPQVEQLRLRAAYGQAGENPSAFAAARTYGTSTVTLPDGSSVPALTYGAIGNPDLRPERGSEIELGFDASLLGDRLGLEFTYYDQTTRDLILSSPVPPSSGFSWGLIENLGEASNRGIELMLNTTPVQMNNLTWDASLNFSTNYNKLVSFGDDRDPQTFGVYAPVQRHIEGYPLAGFWGRHAIRGDDGRPVLDEDGTPQVEDDLRYIGSSVPTREAGMTNTITLFDDLSFFVLLDYQGGHYQFNYRDGRRHRTGVTEEVNDPDFDPAERALLRYEPATAQFIERADFLKLRDVSVQYNLPGMLTETLGVDGAQISLTGHNMAILWTRYNGLDPEVNFHGDADFSRLDSWTAPQMRRVSARLRLSF